MQCAQVGESAWKIPCSPGITVLALYRENGRPNITSVAQPAIDIQQGIVDGVGITELGVAKGVIHSTF